MASSLASWTASRIAGTTPGIVYGGEGQPQLVELDHNALYHALKKEAFHSSILDLEIEIIGRGPLHHEHAGVVGRQSVLLDEARASGVDVREATSYFR